MNQNPKFNLSISKSMVYNAILIQLLALVFINPVLSQKAEVVIDKDALIVQAKKELDLMMKNPESDLRKQAAKHHVKGEYIFDITLKAKGRVLSVFVVSTDADDIQQQNMVKDWVRALDFDVEVPKNITCKFQYSFHF